MRGGLATRLVVAGLVLGSSISLQGCLPPDWSFCDCDFRDNFWNAVINDVHRLWDGPGFVQKVRDNSTWHGKYMDDMPEGYDCPVVADLFWKGWPKMGLTRSLIEGSMGDLWMPAARDRFKSVCIAGHFSLITICAHHFLTKAARSLEAAGEDHMKWLEAAFSHIIAIRNLAQEFRLRQCMPQQGYSVKAWEMLKWAEKWVGKESEGTNPVAAYSGGRLDPYGMMFSDSMAFTERSRKDALPDRRPCVPFKNPQCWKRMSKLLMETCEYCCSPFAHPGGRGHPGCFDSVWTYEKCCQTDFKDLECKMKRKGEEGGCVDCKKTVSYVCLTPPEKRLEDAQENYNKEVDKYNELQKDATRLAKEAEAARLDLEQKTVIYQDNYQDYDVKLRIWSVAYNNETRLVAHGRMNQQNSTWNNSAAVLAAEQAALRSARSARENATRALKGAEDSKARAEGLVKSNQTADAKAAEALQASRERLWQARDAQRSAELAAAQAAAAAAAVAAEAEVARVAAAAAARSRDAVLAETAAAFDAALAAEHVSEAAEHAARLEDDAAAAVATAANAANASAKSALDGAAADVVKAERAEEQAAAAENATIAAAEEAAQRLQQAKHDVEATRSVGRTVNTTLLGRTSSNTAMRCLMDHTPANLSARPRIVPGAAPACGAGENASDSSTGDAIAAQAAPSEDSNEFCKSWAKAGQCEENPEFMVKKCPRSCASAGTAGRSPACAAAAGPGAAGAEALAAAAAELVAAAVALPPGAWSVLPQALVDTVPETFKTQLGWAANGLKDAQSEKGASEQNLTAVGKVLAAAGEALRAAEAAERVEQEKHGAAQADLVAKFAVREAWERMLEGNITASRSASQTSDARKDDARRHTEAVKQAVSLEQTLQKARLSAEGTASKRQAAAARAKRRCELLDEHIRTLNESMSENVTTAVAAWMEEKEAQQRESGGTDGGWGYRLFKAAKDVLVSIVGSLESFLERYVMSLTDRESAAELVRAVEDQRLARTQLQDAEKVSADADVQARDAAQSERRAEAARGISEDALKQAQESALQAEAAAIRAAKVLEATNSSLANATAQWEAAHEVFVRAEAALQRASEAAAAAAVALDGARQQLKVSEDRLQTALRAVEVAAAVVGEASQALEAAAIGASRMYLAELQDTCKASEEDFDFYMQHVDLISLLHAVVAQRDKAMSLANLKHSNATSASVDAQAAHAAMRRGAADAREALGRRASELEAASRELAERLAVRNATASSLAQASERFQLDANVSRSLAAGRQNASAAAGQASVGLAEAEGRARKVLAESEVWRREVRKAFNGTNASIGQMLDAEEVKKKAKDAWAEANIWAAQHVESLMIPNKQTILNQSVAYEQWRNELEVNASKHHKRMKDLFGTHQRRLRDLNAELELDRKTSERNQAQDRFQASEKATVAANTLLEKTTKEEKTCHENIGKAYHELNRLLTEHAAATKAHAEQDPVDRERSFSTYLEGSGADPR